jgi:single-strand selective monofunctional uracil DNA glycosylase
MKENHPLVDAALRMREGLRDMKFSTPVSHVYQPLDYAWDRHLDYLKLYGNGKKRTLFLGMNPGPYGMAQTGIPFGEISAVRDWMNISGWVGQPSSPHPKRPITGFACTRSEVSGRRLWGLFSSRFPNPNDFFLDHFVINYCPLIWMSHTGANITPDKLTAAERDAVDRICLAHLHAIITILEPQHLIGVGAYARERLENIHTPSLHRVAQILHPSPASPAANKDWSGTALKQLIQANVWEQPPSQNLQTTQ